MKCSFSMEHYRQILLKAKNSGYRFASFKDNAIPKDHRIIFLRHDVDGSPEAALEMAIVEADLGVSANYFFFEHGCPLYSMSSPVTQVSVGMIAKIGHSVGRQVTSTKSIRDNPGKPFNIMEYSIHTPKQSSLGAKTLPRSTYDPRFFSEIFYISDSRGQWREKCACNYLDGRQMQLLIHPEWWTNTKKYLDSSVSTMIDDAESYIKDIFPGV